MTGSWDSTAPHVHVQQAACHTPHAVVRPVSASARLTFGAEYLPEPVGATADCRQEMWLTLFFDGTGNNEKSDTLTFEHSDVARLYHAMLDAKLRIEHGTDWWDRKNMAALREPGARQYLAQDISEAPGGHMKPHRAFRLMLLSLLLMPVLASCQQDKVMLGIVGYNYTDRYIDRFSVDGAGGGNIHKSTLTSGGGGTTCCAVYNPAYKLPITMSVEWMFGYQRGPDGKIVVPDEHHKATAVLNGPVPEDPAYLEVHFMPDGTVQLKITAVNSPPLIRINRPGPKIATPEDL